MIPNNATYQLMTWLSPSFPVGAYAFSHALEQVVSDGRLDNAPAVQAWLEDLITTGSGHSDLVFVAAGWRAGAGPEKLAAANELALAFCSSVELRLETTAQGRAFVDTVAETWPCAAASALQRMPGGDIAYPVAVGAIAADYGIDEMATLTAYAHAFIANLVSAAVRLVPLGQTDGQRITARLADSVSAAAAIAHATPVDAVSSNTLASEIASMQHENLYTRLFRS